MSVNTTKEILCINQVIGQKTDTIIIEEDFVVPDIKPDILNTVTNNGTVCIYKKEVMDGKIKLDGTINVYVMYLADDEESTIRSLNVNLDFSQTIEFNEVKMGMTLEDRIQLKSVECRVLNGRKVNIRGMIELDLKVSSNEDLEFVKEIEDIKDIQLLNEKLSINSLLGKGLAKVYAKDTIVIDNIDNLAEIMKVDIKIVNRETKISYNKVLVKADACVKVIYLTEDNRICSVTNMIPIMGFIDMPNVTDDNLCDIKYEIKNILIKPNSVEEHSIYIEIELEVNCQVYETKEMDVIQDLYSPTIDLVYKQKMIKTMSKKEIIRDLCSIREKQFISGLGNNKIYDVDVMPTITNKTVLKDRIIYEGEVELKFLFQSTSGNRVDTKNMILPFTHNMDCMGIDQNSEVDTQMDITLQDFVVMPDESIDIKIDLEFMVNKSVNKRINVIEEINIDEDRVIERCSMVIYFVKPGDTLWNIAKRFRSTVTNIIEINNIEDESRINIGEQLFIPMC